MCRTREVDLLFFTYTDAITNIYYTIRLLIGYAKRSELLHSRPIADCILASIVSKRKLKKYKIRWGYDLPQSIVDLLCTFTR